MTLSDIGGEPGPATAKQELSQDERAELERLRAEAAEAGSSAPSWLSSAARGRPRPAENQLADSVAVLLITIGCLFAPISVLGIGLANQVSNTSRYVANVEPLIYNPAIQNALTDQLTNQITSHLNITNYTNQAAALLTSKGLSRVGTLLKSFGPSIASAITGFIHSQVHGIVTSPKFAQAWVQVNTVAHQELVRRCPGRANPRSASATARSSSTWPRSSISSSSN